jgi:hypothetical protein
VARVGGAVAGAHGGAMPNRRLPRTAALALAAAPLTGCGQLQEARPLSLTVPLAALSLTAAVVLGVLAWAVMDLVRDSVRRRGLERTSPTWRPGVVTAVGALGALTVVLPLAGTTLLVNAVAAVDYRRPKVDIFSWEDVAVMGAVLSVAAGLTTSLALRLVLALRRESRWAVWGVRALALGAVAGALSWPVVLAPALLTAGLVWWPPSADQSSGSSPLAMRNPRARSVRG